MARKALDSYVINGERNIVKVGDKVLVRNVDPNKPSSIARVETIQEGSSGNVKVRLRWYYRPEDCPSGRQQFHGQQEVFLSDRVDVRRADTIEGKCIVHTVHAYRDLEAAGVDDYFCRFEYNAATGDFTADDVRLHCTCRMLYNPDHNMIYCKRCQTWFHLHCVGLSNAEAKRVSNYKCANCSPASVNSGPSSSTPDANPGAKRPRR